MISKKQALTLGILALGGVAAASAIASSDGDGGGAGATMEGVRGRAGGILGSQQGYTSPGVFQIPAQADVIFPKQPNYTNILKDFIKPEGPVSRGTQGVSSAGKIRVSHKKIVESGFPVSTTFTGTPTTPSFVQKDIYHKAMLAELGLSPKIVSGGGGGTSKKSVTTGRASSKAVQKARATVRHTAARKKRMNKK